MTEKESVLSVLSDQIAAMKLEKGIAEKQLIDKDKISVLGNRLSELELEKAGIMEEMHELQKEISVITDKYNIKCSKVDDLTQVLNNRELLINNLKIENENLLLYQNNLLSEAQRKDKEILELTKIKMNMKDEINNKEEEVISLQQKLRDSKIHLDCALTKIGSISSENEDKISKLRDEIVELRSHLDDTVLIKEQIYSEKVKLEKEIMCKNNSLSELENEISTLKLDKVRFDQLLAEQELEVGILSDQIIAIKLEKEEAEKQLINKDSEVSALAKKLSEFELEKTGIIEKVHELEKEISIITDKCNSKCFEVDRLTKEINAKELLINCLQNENKNLILCQNNVLSELQTELLESKETIRNLEETLSNKELVINKAVFENKELKKQKDLISTEMKIMRQSKILIENELKNKHKVLKQYDQKIENLENNTDKLTLNLNKLSKENVELTNKLMESTNKLGEMDFERTKLTEKLSLSDSKINELNALCNEYKEKVNTLETKQEEMYAVYKDTKSKYVLLKQEITVIENENELLMNKKTQLSAALCEANNIMKVQGSKIEESNLLKEAYNKLVEDNDRLQDENKQLTERLDDVVKEKEQIGTKSTTSLQLHEEQIRNDYEQRLQHAKNQMKAVYNTQKIKIEEQKTKELQQYKDKIQRDQDHIAELSSQLWNTNDRLLTLKQENEDLKSMLQHSRLQTYELPDRRTLSLDQICLPSRRKENTEVLEIIDETITRRHSTRVVPSGMGKVFPSEDEQGEVFNNTYLADLKAGRCIVDNSDRISTLQYRNSLCPPHLKSSYPAETQFLATEKIKEDEIKGGLVTSDKENLLPGEKTRKKDKNQISYKKPGPPTPSKNGGRQLLQNVTEQLQLVTPRGILRENNSEKHRPRVSTPARIKALFTGRRKDENVTTTPKTRKSLFFQKH